MQTQDVELYLHELGLELQHLGVATPIRVLLVGGAYMLTQGFHRPATNDVDVLLKDGDDPTALAHYQAFRTAIRIVATRNRLPVIWLNEMIGDFLRDAGTPPSGTLWRRYAMLEVYVPPADYILALKLLAGRRKDWPDIIVLCERLAISTRAHAQQIVDHYIPNRQLQKLSDLDQTLDQFFPSPDPL